MFQRLFLSTILGFIVRGILIKSAKSNQQLGVVDNQYKKLLPGDDYDAYIDSADLTIMNIEQNTTIEDSVRLAIHITKKFAYQTSKLAKLFDKSLPKKELLQQVFDFAYHHIRYQQDHKLYEQIRTPARTWHDRATGVDCDCFSVFIGSILMNLKVPFRFRITDYGKGWQHIYVVSTDDYGNEVPLDPVIRVFDYEKPYKNKKDYYL